MKKVLFIPVGVLALIIALFILAGTPLILNYMKSEVENTIKEKTEMDFSIDNIKGNLFYALDISSVAIDTAFFVENIQLRYNIISLLSRKVDISSLTIEGLEVNVDRLTSTLEKMTPPEQLKETTPSTRTFKIVINELNIKNSNVSAPFLNDPIHASLTFNGSFANSIMYIDTLFLSTERSSIACKGYIPLDDSETMHISYNACITSDDINVRDLSGTILSNGSITGLRIAPIITTNSILDIAYQDGTLQGRITGTWRTPSIDSISLVATLNASLPGFDREQITCMLDISARAFQGNITSHNGSLYFNGSISGILEKPEVDAYIAGKLKFQQLTPSIKGSVRYSNNLLQLKNISLDSRKITVVANGTIAMDPHQTIKGTVTLATTDVSFINEFLDEPLSIQGELKSSIQISGSLERPTITSNIAIRNAHFYSEKIQTADIKAGLDGNRVSIDSAYIESARGPLAVKGSFNIRTEQYFLSIQSSSLSFSSPEVFITDTLLLSGSIGADISLSGQKNQLHQGKAAIFLRDIEYDTLILGGYDIVVEIEEQNIVYTIKNLTNTLHCRGTGRLSEPYPFATQLDMRHFDIHPYMPVDSGYITARITMEGNLADIQKTAGQVEFDSLYLYTKNGTIQNPSPILITAADEYFHIERCSLSVQAQVLSLTGYIPFNYENKEINIALKTPRLDIADLAWLIPDAPPVTGIIEIDLIAVGPMRSPTIDGTLMIENMQMIFPQAHLDSVNVLIVSHGYDISIKHVRGWINRGTFNLSGSLRLSEQGIDSLSALCSIHSMNIEDRSFGKATLSADLKASAHKLNTSIAGEVYIDNAIYNVPFNMQSIISLLTRVNQPPPEQDELIKKIHCDVGISSVRNIKIANNIAMLEALVDLQVKGDLSRLNTYGTITSSKKGMVKYLGKKFEITNAVIQFDDPYKINPFLDLEAMNSIESIDGDFEIYLRLSGTTEKWRLELTSSPPVPEQDIISLLLVGRRRPDTDILGISKNLNLKGAAKDYALELARGTISRTAEEKLGLEKFIISGDLLDPHRLDIGIEKRIGERITVIYGTGIETWELRRIGVNYDLTRNLSILTLHDQENVNSSIDIDVHFNLK